MTGSRDLHAVLRVVHAVLERNGIWHCLFFGTLLGAVREGDVIGWDHDIDLLIRPADVPRILGLQEEFERKGIHVWAGRGTGNWLAFNPGRIPWFELGCLGILSEGQHAGELWAPTLFADGFLRPFDLQRGVYLWPETSFAAYFVETLTDAEIGGHRYPAPACATMLLSFLYGKDWHVPYRAPLDGGDERDGSTRHGNSAEPNLGEQIEWCEAAGWDRSRYAGQPAWPRPIHGAGPTDNSSRAAATSRSAWWHSLDELAAHY